ncbi:MAG: hypothetical protein EOO04_39355, partial [Chitinophagaceae bacterium]
MLSTRILLGVFSLFMLQSQAQSGLSKAAGDSVPQLSIKKEPRFTFNVHGGYGVGLGSTFKFYPDDISSVAVSVVENTPVRTSTSYK